MAVSHPRTGKIINVPWNEEFDQFLGWMSNKTYEHNGDELLHEMHKDVIEAKHLMIRFYTRLRRMLAVCIGLLALILALIAVAMFLG